MANHPRSSWSDVDARFARMGQAQAVPIHHTASRASWAFDPAELRRLEHAEIALGYNALAYHSMFMLDGDSAESRPYGAMGAATGGRNHDTIALCAIGYFHRPHHDQPTDALIYAMAREIKWLRDVGFVAPFAPVAPHAVFTAGTPWSTACCGEDFIPMVAEIERLSYLDLDAPPAPPPPPPAPSGVEPVVAIEYKGQLVTFRVDAAGNLTETFYDGAGWGTVAIAGPACALAVKSTEPARLEGGVDVLAGWSGSGPDRLDVFAVAQNGSLIHAWYNGTGTFASETL